ncbi:hypothetical protein SAMN03080601_03438 [Alkalitalea saponilacus]|uniref:Uncharacterized protein n=1 Tax=Alkalitalea saponilacus TaxID=889453 RepID=A0A1T5HTY5_9BACT|nr:hypothetical protein SAMN03080601_03438 [Alkalitalea saponilacus]
MIYDLRIVCKKYYSFSEGKFSELCCKTRLEFKFAQIKFAKLALYQINKALIFMLLKNVSFELTHQQ